MMEKPLLTPSRKSLLAIYKSFSKPNLNHAGVIHDNPLHESFKRKIDVFQYKASLVIIGAIKGTSRDKLYLKFSSELLEVMS